MTGRQLYFALPILRGLLAERSANADDPYSRVILGSNLTLILNVRDSSLPPLQLAAGEENASADLVREKFRAAIDQFKTQHGQAPASVKFDEDAALRRIARYQPGAAKSRIALVTGAAGAIGAGLCRGLLEYGYRVAATDLVKEALEDLVSELKPAAPDRIIGVQMDVTDKESVAAGFAAATGQWGGVDIVVVNAGIAMVAPLMDLDPETFRKLEKVNVEGALLTLAEAGRCLCRQNTGGDIILVSSKNVFAPGAQFGAYSATKAASHQLARIASLEYAPFDIRVNMVAPDAVFSEGKRQSGLWAEIGPARMQARGLDAKGLEEYYRNRNLLKARVTAAHVANAVLFFATRQTPTTGATIPVDGGLPDATPR